MKTPIAFSRIFLLFFSISVFLGSPFQAFSRSSFGMRSFLKQWIAHQSEHFTSKIEVLKQKALLKGTSQFWNSSLEFSPLLGRKAQVLQNQETTADQSGVEVKWNHEFFSGTSVLLQYHSLWNLEDGKDTLRTQDFTFSVEQSLLKNPFGYLRSLQTEKQQASLDFAQKKSIQTQLRLCQDGIQTYLKAFYLQKSTLLQKKLLKWAQKNLAFSKKRYHKRLLSKLDLLQIQMQAIEQEETLEKAQLEKKRFFLKLKPFLNTQIMFPSPWRWFQKKITALTPPSLKKSLSLSLSELSLTQAEKQVEILKRTEGSEIHLFLRGALSERPEYVQAGSDPLQLKERSFEVGVKFLFSLYQPLKSAQGQMALEEKKKQALLLKTERERVASLREEYFLLKKHFQKELRFLEKRFQKEKEKLTLLKKLFFKGRISPKELFSSQASFVQTELAFLEKKYQFWKGKLFFLPFQNKVPNFCKGHP